MLEGDLAGAILIAQDLFDDVIVADASTHIIRYALRLRIVANIQLQSETSNPLSFTISQKASASSLGLVVLHRSIDIQLDPSLSGQVQDHLDCYIINRHFERWFKKFFVPPLPEPPASCDEDIHPIVFISSINVAVKVEGGTAGQGSLYIHTVPESNSELDA
ncbi:hypothetical protein PIB30_027583 [Stylosanthes scabra]|uniref:Uncharacterized protein n=1 Tax=Stylosanthes scabra TaxID=79078 RepID=A0ABU6W8R0_9FABA|nr:hypothetical protein [Stylosanthes scabra]